MSGIATIAGTSGESDGTDGLACLAGAVYAYLLEIDGYCAVCKRHEGTVLLRERDEGLEVARFFEFREETIMHLRSALRQFPDSAGDHLPPAKVNGRQSPVHPRTGQRAWMPSPTALLLGGIAWEGRSSVISAHGAGSDPILQVNLLLTRLEGDLPELPLKMLACALRGHEFLVPEIIAKPVPPPHQGMPFLTIREHLKRTMPLNLYASKCFLAGGAGT